MKNIGILDPEGKNDNPLTNTPYSQNYKDLAKKWSILPAYKHIKDIIKKVEQNQVILVVSTTGSGKTVLLPKIVLHTLNYNGKIAITLPKQIITKTAAEYASATLDVKLGEHVGYQFKGSPQDSKSDMTKLLYATDGTIVARLMKDPLLKDYDAVIIDEAHERKVQIDFLIYLLKQTVLARPEFKLVIMSATINKQIFSDYFASVKFDNIDIGGERTYPITSIFLNKPISTNEYIDKGIEIINKISSNKNNDGDILFFVTSVNETFEACKHYNIEPTDKYCVEVYAGINQDKQNLAQDKALYKTLYNKDKKIVIATNVAESSLTIDGIKYVVDSGLELHGWYDPVVKARKLNKELITHAQAVQRMGRAGRTSAGTCYHLYTKDDFENKMKPFPEPTIKVSNIYGECLRLLNLQTIANVHILRHVLSEFIEPPTEIYVDTAIDELKELNLIDNSSLSISNLGILVNTMQFEPMQSLAIYMAYKLSCMREVLAIIIMIDAMRGNLSDLFIKPNIKDKVLTDKFITSKKSLGHKYGDHLTLLSIYTKYLELEHDSDKSKLDEWMQKFYLKKSTLEKANKYYKSTLHATLHSLKTSGVKNIGSEELNDYDMEHRVLACIAFGYKLNHATLSSQDKYNTSHAKNVTINKDSFITKHNEHKKIMYHELFSSSNKMDLHIVSYLTPSISKLLKHISVLEQTQ